jgi:hypothetical protein
VLERLREELRKRDYVPIVFNFNKPETKDFRETVRLLADLSKFVIADITNPKSSPLRAQATVPEIMVPLQPIVEQGREALRHAAGLVDQAPRLVFEPIEYMSVGRLVETIDTEIIRHAEALGGFGAGFGLPVCGFMQGLTHPAGKGVAGVGAVVLGTGADADCYIFWRCRGAMLPE